MADHNTIADATWNPVRDSQPAPEVLGQPWHWVKPRRISVSSKFDLFHESVPFEYVAAVFWVMSVTTRHTYQVLTKRPARMLEFFRWVSNGEDGSESDPDDWISSVAMRNPAIKALGWTPATSRRGGYDCCGPLWPYQNVWLGVSVENQAAAAERIPLLLQCPSAVRWLSCEPLLGHVDLCETLGMWWNQRLASWEVTGSRPIDWVVAGGESGPGARPTHPDWTRSLRDQCAAAGVPFLFKQWGEWAPYGRSTTDDSAHVQSYSADMPMQRFGKKLAGRLLDGVEHNAYPEPAR